jgi:serine/threonine-protein kinase
MGAVYEATHAEIGKRVAIKVLSPVVAAVPGARARFLREAQLTTRVRHPHIVDVTDMGTDEGQTYLVMELLAGQDLAQRLERGGALGVEELADILLPVCSAMVAAHQAGITHRDLKPQNIFIDTSAKRSHPKVLDFGISKGNDAAAQTVGTLTATGAMIGTPYYLAPEQILDNKSAGPSSDQYAVGVILYECLTGVRPFDGDNLFMVFQGIVGGNPRPPRQIRPDIPPALEEIVLRAMRTDPKARFPSIEALGRALLPFASGRARMIWEDAFSGGVPAGGPGAPAWPSASAPTPVPTLSAAARMAPTPGASTPSVQKTIALGSRTPGSTPAPRVFTPGTPAPASAPMRTPTPPPVYGPPAAMTAAPIAEDAFVPPRRRRAPIAIAAVVVVGGGIAAFVAMRGKPNEPPAVPIAAPALPTPAPAPAPVPAPPTAATPEPTTATPEPAAKPAPVEKPAAAAKPAAVHKPRPAAKPAPKPRPAAKPASAPRPSGGVPIVD